MRSKPIRQQLEERINILSFHCKIKIILNVTQFDMLKTIKFNRSYMFQLTLQKKNLTNRGKTAPTASF
jgi:hypothetical protein